MIWRSLKWRLFLAATIFIFGALVIYANVLTQIFERHVSERLYGELEAHLNRLTAIVEIDENDNLSVEEAFVSSRFNKPFGGLYWHVSSSGLQDVASRSLWDQELSVPDMSQKPGQISRHDNIAFNGGKLLAIERSILISGSSKQHEVSMIMAMDRADLEKAIILFDADVAKLVLLLALFLVAAAGAQILIGLRPLATLSNKLKTIGSRGPHQNTPGLKGNFPTEVQRLVEGLNTLLHERETMVEKARARASDLAHGLKTPLAILAAESRTLKSGGDAKIAREISNQIDAMNRHVERQLVMARMGSKTTLTHGATLLKPVLEKYITTFKKIRSDRPLQWDLQVKEGLEAKIDALDIEEVIGNLFDNASKWAKHKIIVNAQEADGLVEIQVCDDGPGVPEIQLQKIVQRGGRLDETMPGSGLGLAIVNDIIDAHDGHLHIENNPSGGLMVRVAIPN